MSPTTKDQLRLPPEALRHSVDPQGLPTVKEYSRHRTHIIGQDRAIRALDLGLRLESPGYNVFLSGPSGSGRMTTARHILETFKHPRRPLRDFVYVHNFEEPDRARLLVLEPGQGARLKKAMDALVRAIKRELPRTLGQEVCQKERDRIMAEFRRRETDIVSAFQARLRRADFALVEMQDGAMVERDVLPIMDGEPQSLAALEERMAAGSLSVKRRQQLERKRQEMRLGLDQIQRRTRVLARDMVKLLEDFDRRVGSAVIDVLIEDLREPFKKDHEVDAYVDEVREALLERIPFLVQHGEEGPGEGDGPAAPRMMPQPDPLAPFQVNVVLANSRRKGCPVVFEHTPTLVRLFGTIERSAEDGPASETDFMNIRAGALARADGGFLVVSAEDLLVEPGTWKTLKRTLSSGLLDVRTPENTLASTPTAFKPDPMPIDVKVIMLGDEEVYRLMYLNEDDFKKTFKVKAEFDVEMEYSPPNLEKFLAFVARVVAEEKLLRPSAEAIAMLVEESMRDAEDRAKLSTRFSVVADLLRESSHWARLEGRRRIAAENVACALADRYRRVNLAEEKYRESIDRDVIKVSTSGSRVGQVNGLAVFDLGDYSFGKPCRISASVGAGRAGLINIEREAGLSGETHDKGVYILTGYLRNRFGRATPLSFDASVCFEQSYGEIDGDSASSTEMYAILSCLADVPLAQGIAVTGSVSQHGEVQAIGGINHKIEGFFEICQTRVLDGTQGVLIPRANLVNLMLRRDVVDAVRQGLFHVWAVSSIDEGMEILTDLPAGEEDESGTFPAGTINRRIADRLRAMAETMRGSR